MGRVCPFRDQHETNQDEKGQAQHLNGRGFVDKITDRRGKDNHNDDGGHYRHDHDNQVVGKLIQTCGSARSGIIVVASVSIGRVGLFNPIRVIATLSGYKFTEFYVFLPPLERLGPAGLFMHT